MALRCGIFHGGCYVVPNFKQTFKSLLSGPVGCYPEFLAWDFSCQTKVACCLRPISKIGCGRHNLAFSTFTRQHLKLGKFDILKIVFYTFPWKVRTPGRDLLCVGVCSAAPQRPSESQCPHPRSWAALSHRSLLLPVGCMSSQSALGLVELSSPSSHVTRWRCISSSGISFRNPGSLCCSSQPKPGTWHFVQSALHVVPGSPSLPTHFLKAKTI